MKFTKKELKEANQKLAAYNLEIEEINPTTKKFKCFCKNLNYTPMEYENMELINSELRDAKSYSDIKWMSYFK